MSIRTSIILVVALVMVSGYVFFVQIRESSDAQEQPPWFYNVDMSDMNRISITDREEEAVFFLGEDQRWHLDDPEGLPAGLDRWGGIVLLLSGPRTRRLLDAQPTDLAPYGLDSPPIRFDVDLKDGRVIPVLLGLPTPNGVGYYAQVEGFPQVYTVASGWGEVLTRLIYEPPFPEWYYNIDTAELTIIEFQLEDKTVGLSSDGDGWSFYDEGATPVDDELLSSTFASLGKPSQTLVEYKATDLAPYGLDKPQLTLVMQTKRPGPGVNVNIFSDTAIHIGIPTEDGTGYYARTEQDGTGYYGQADPEPTIPDVYEVNAEWAEALLAIATDPSHPGTVPQES